MNEKQELVKTIEYVKREIWSIKTNINKAVHNITSEKIKSQVVEEKLKNQKLMQIKESQLLYLAI